MVSSKKHALILYIGKIISLVILHWNYFQVNVPIIASLTLTKCCFVLKQEARFVVESCTPEDISVV